jgi:hypothetical protein
MIIQVVSLKFVIGKWFSMYKGDHKPDSIENEGEKKNEKEKKNETDKEGEEKRIEVEESKKDK